MSQGYDENLGFHSRMSELELRLKQSEDERLALEKKFNKLLSDRKSQEEMHLYMLRENYSQLLRQDKMRCDRNDMILQKLANIESRASMLTAKTDRLRLLRQHYESSVSRHYPSIKKGVGRYRSVESLISNTCENTNQQSVSSSPRLMSSYSPSPFLRSPSITRRNSLVISNSEIQDPINYKILNKLNFTSNTSRRRLFDDFPQQEKNSNSKTTPFCYDYSENDKKENLLRSNIVSTFIVSNTDDSKVESKDRTRSSEDLILNTPSLDDLSEQKYMKECGGLTKSGKATVKINQPTLFDGPRKYERLSSSRAPVSFYPSKPVSANLLTKSSSFNLGSGFSRNVSNYFLPERRQSTFVRRPSFVYQKANYSQSYGKFQTPKTNSFSYTGKEIPTTWEKYSHSGFSKPHFGERAKPPLSDRDMSPAIIKSKSPLTVVDDIFKKYLINYDRRYLSDPISESKYGKYLQPSSYYDSTFREDQRINKPSNLVKSKYNGQTSYLEDISIPSQESLSSHSYSKTLGSQDSLLYCDRSSIFHERNMAYSDDRNNWKEWNHYKNRYEYPSRLGSESPFIKSPFTGDDDDDYYYSNTGRNIGKELNWSTPYHFLDDLSPKYSYALKIGGGSNEHDEIPEAGFETVRSQGSLKSHESMVAGKQEFSSKDNFRIPQTSKKVSFSNEFLYNDKSDTETSSNADKPTIHFDDNENSKIITECMSTPSSEVKDLGQHITNLARETEPYQSMHSDKELGIKDTKNPLADGTLEGTREVSPKKYLTNPANSDELKFNSDVLNLNYDGKKFKLSDDNGPKNNTSNIQDLKFTSEKENKNIFELQKKSDADPNTESNSDQNVTGNNPKVTIPEGSDSIKDEKEEDQGEMRSRQVSAESKTDERKYLMEKGGGNKQSSSGPKDSSIKTKTTDLISSARDPNLDLDTQNETFPKTGDEELSSQNNTELGNSNLYNGKDFESHSVAGQDTELQKYGSAEYLKNQEPADVETNNKVHGRLEIGSNEEQQVLYEQEANKQVGSYDNHLPQKDQEPIAYNNNPDISEYSPDLNREQYEQSNQQYDQYNLQKDYVSSEYIQNDAPGYGNTQDVSYGPETFEPKDYQQPEVYPVNQYEKQDQEYEGKGFKGSQQSIQDFPLPVPQQQYKDDRYINQDRYEPHDQQYSPENLPEAYVADQPYEGEYPPEYSQQQYDPNYQNPTQVPQNAPEQYKTDYNADYQDDSQYEYNQMGSTYDEQYEQHGPQYNPQQQPEYDQYEQQPIEPSYDQYEQQPLEPSYDQYEQQTRQPSYEQYEQPHEPSYNQFKEQPAEPPYGQYEQQPSEPPYEQYNQPSGPPYDQYEQPPPGPPYDQYEQQPSEIPYDQYEQQPPEPPYDQYEQHSSEPPYDQYNKQKPSAEPLYDQYEPQPSEPIYDQYEQQPTETPYDQYKQSSGPHYDRFEQQPSEHYDQYQGAPDQYGNYEYDYDQKAPVTDQTYPRDEQQNYTEETKPYYNELLQQPYNDVVQPQNFTENDPYDRKETIYPPDQNLYRDEQQVYESSAYSAQNLNESQHEQFSSDYDYSQVSQPQNSQLSVQQDEALYEPDTITHNQADLGTRDTCEPIPKLNQTLESDPDSSVVQEPVSHEDSSDFDFSAGKK